MTPLLCGGSGNRIGTVKFKGHDIPQPLTQSRYGPFSVSAGSSLAFPLPLFAQVGPCA